MLDLQPVPVSRRINPRPSKTTLKQISITDPKLIHIEPQRHRQRQTTLPPFPVTNRLRGDVEKVRRNRHIFSEPEREPGADTLVNRVTEVTPDTQRAEYVVVNVLCDRNCELNVSPELVVGLIGN